MSDETTRSNTQSQEAADRTDLRMACANPAQNYAQLEAWLDELDGMAYEDRWCSEADYEELLHTLAMYDAEILRSNTQSQDEVADEGMTTMNDERQIHTKCGPPLPTVRTNELVRPSEAGWVSFNDDPWTTSKDMAAKHKAELAVELYEFTTQSGQGWWGELSEAGFGPKALVGFKSAHKECADFDPERAEHIPAQDESLIRREAGFRWDESSQYRLRIRGQYRDYLAAAGVFPMATDEDDEVVTEDDDLWKDGVLDHRVHEAHLGAEGTTEDEQAKWERILQAEGLGEAAPVKAEPKVPSRLDDMRAWRAATNRSKIG